MRDTDPIRVFISSKQIEFAEERRAIRAIVESSPLMAPVLGEDFVPERSDARSRYLADVDRCPIYVGLFGCTYSASTEDEYRHALHNPTREVLLYVRPCPDRRDEKLSELIKEFERNHVTTKLESIPKLRKTFIDHLHGAIVRMVTLLLDQREAPRPQGGPESSTERDWHERRVALRDFGFPVDAPEMLGNLANRYRVLAQHVKQLDS